MRNQSMKRWLTMSSLLGWNTKNMNLAERPMRQIIILLPPENQALEQMETDQPSQSMLSELQEVKVDLDEMVILVEPDHQDLQDCLVVQEPRVCQDPQDHFLTSNHT